MTVTKASAQLDGTGRERGELQLKASGERHDGLCARCLDEGVEEKVTMRPHSVAMPLLSHWWHSQRRQSSTTPPQFAFWTRGLLVANWTVVGNSESNVGSDDVGPRHTNSTMDEVGD